MKICYIADATSIHIVEWLKYFVEKKHDLHLISDTTNKIEGVVTYNIGDCLPRFHLPLLAASYQIFRKTQKRVMDQFKAIFYRIQKDYVQKNNGQISKRINAREHSG